MMEIETASEAIDEDADSNDGDPDSMDLLMGEIEIPLEPPCHVDNLEKNTIHLSSLPCFLEEVENKSIPSSASIMHLGSLKKCHGYANAKLFSDLSATSTGFLRSGELERTLKGLDPVDIPNEVTILNEGKGCNMGVKHFEKKINKTPCPHYTFP